MSNSLEDLELSTAIHMLDLTAISESRLLRNALIPPTFGYLEQFIIHTQTDSSYVAYIGDGLFSYYRDFSTRVLPAVCVISSHMPY